jgi:hypothetical protein
VGAACTAGHLPRIDFMEVYAQPRAEVDAAAKDMETRAQGAAPVVTYDAALAAAAAAAPALTVMPPSGFAAAEHLLTPVMLAAMRIAALKPPATLPPDAAGVSSASPTHPGETSAVDAADASPARPSGPGGLSNLLGPQDSLGNAAFLLTCPDASSGAARPPNMPLACTGAVVLAAALGAYGRDQGGVDAPAATVAHQRASLTQTANSLAECCARAENAMWWTEAELWDFFFGCAQVRL